LHQQTQNLCFQQFLESGLQGMNKLLQAYDDPTIYY
jgi:hypothetical protein